MWTAARAVLINAADLGPRGQKSTAEPAKHAASDAIVMCATELVVWTPGSSTASRF